MNLEPWFQSARQAASGWVCDRAASMGAALSYYTVFSIAPLLLIVISVAGLVFGEEAARGAIVGQLQGLLGDDAAATLQEMLQHTAETDTGVIGTIVGLVLLLVGATTVFAELQDDLNRIWKVPERAKPKGLWGWIRARILSFGLILAIGFVLVASLVASAAIAAVGKWGGGLVGAWETVAHLVEVVVSFGLLTVVFAVMYRFLPDVKIAWRDVWIGAAVTALLFSVGKFLIGLYIGKSGTASAYGAAGSLVVMLLWVYYSSQIFLFGAEFTASYAHSYGSRRDKPQPQGAAPGVEPPPRPVAAGARPAPAGQPRGAARPGGPAGQPLAARVAASPTAMARTTSAHPVKAVVEPAPNRMVEPIARHPVSAIGLAAGLGAALAYGLERLGVVPAPGRGQAARTAVKLHGKAAQSRFGFVSRRPGRPAPRAPTRSPRAMARQAGIGLAKAVASGVGAMLVKALGVRVRRGAKRGWDSRKAKVA